MVSALSWLDFAESDRQRAMQVIDMFREKGTVDELGFAPIRDAFADHFFPGTSTIQTRARYFLFVPWIMKRYHGRKMTAQERANALRRRETQLIQALITHNADDFGIIGREAKGTLRRMPSSVYWRGLHLWNIRLFDGSIDQYLNRLSRGRRHTGPAETDDREPLASISQDWHPDLPEEPDDVYESASMDLRLEEAEFLRDRIYASQPDSVLAHLFRCGVSEFDDAYVWASGLSAKLPRDLQEKVEHARLFSLCAWGGPLVYSRCIAQLKTGQTDFLEQIEASLGEWQGALAAEVSRLRDWDQAAFWKLIEELNPRLSPRTREFAQNWINIASRAAKGEPVWRDDQVAKLIADRERQLKGGRSRLAPENLRARDRWEGDASGAMIDYRWGQTQVILNDILRGLSSGEQGAGNA